MSNGQPAAVIGSFHTCPKTTGNVPHVGGPAVTGSPSVFFNGKPAARVGDGTAHGGVLTNGNGTVLIDGGVQVGSGTSGKVVAGNGVWGR